MNIESLLMVKNTSTGKYSYSKPKNLILDNFGKWLAGFIRAPVAADTNVTLVDVANNSVAIKVFDDATSHFNMHSGGKALGTQIQLGDDNTAATRSDYKVGSALASAPESSPFDTGTGSYSSGSITLSGSVTMGGAETVWEGILIGQWRYSDTPTDFALFHDVLASSVSFALGDGCTAQYVITL